MNYGGLIYFTSLFVDAQDDPSNHPTASTIFLTRSRSEIHKSELIRWVAFNFLIFFAI